MKVEFVQRPKRDNAATQRICEPYMQCSEAYKEKYMGCACYKAVHISEVPAAVTISEAAQPQETLSCDSDKPDLTMIDPGFLIEIAKVLGKGAEKYERDNWRHGTDWNRRIASALRHLAKWQDGEDVDDETGLPHLAHAATNLMFVLYWQRLGLGSDTRYVHCDDADDV